MVRHTVARVLLIVEGDEGGPCRTRSRLLTASVNVQTDHAWPGRSGVRQLLRSAKNALHQGAIRDAWQPQIGAYLQASLMHAHPKAGSRASDTCRCSCKLANALHSTAAPGWRRSAATAQLVVPRRSRQLSTIPSQVTSAPEAEQDGPVHCPGSMHSNIRRRTGLWPAGVAAAGSKYNINASFPNNPTLVPQAVQVSHMSHAATAGSKGA